MHAGQCDMHCMLIFYKTLEHADCRVELQILEIKENTLYLVLGFSCFVLSPSRPGSPGLGPKDVLGAMSHTWGTGVLYLS